MTGGESATARELLRDLVDAPWLDWGVLDHSVDFHEITRFLYLSAYAEGREPHAYRVGLGRVRKGEWRLPEGARVLREGRTRNQRALFAVGDGWSLFVHRYNPGHGGVSVSAVSMELAEQIAEDFRGAGLPLNTRSEFDHLLLTAHERVRPSGARN